MEAEQPTYVRAHLVLAPYSPSGSGQDSVLSTIVPANASFASSVRHSRPCYNLLVSDVPSEPPNTNGSVAVHKAPALTQAHACAQLF